MEAWSGAGKQPGTSLSLPLGRTTLMGNRRPEQELLRHPPPTQSTRVSTLWPAGGTLGPPPRHPWPCPGRLGWVVLPRMERPQAPLLPQCSGRKVRVRHQTQAPEDRARCERAECADVRPDPPSTQSLEDLLWPRRGVGGVEGCQGFLGAGWRCGCRLCRHAGPTQRGACAWASCSCVTILKFMTVFIRLCGGACLGVRTRIRTRPSCLGSAVGGRQSANTPSSPSDCRDGEQAFPGLGPGGVWVPSGKRERTAPASPGCR